MGFELTLEKKWNSIDNEELLKLKRGEEYETFFEQVSYVIYSDGSIARLIKGDRPSQSNYIPVSPGIDGLERFSECLSYKGGSRIHIESGEFFLYRTTIICSPKEASERENILFVGCEESGNDKLYLKFRLLEIKLIKGHLLKKDEVLTSKQVKRKFYYDPCRTDIKDFFVEEYTPQVSLLDEHTITFDFSGDKGHIYLSKDRSTKEVKNGDIRRYLDFVDVCFTKGRSDLCYQVCCLQKRRSLYGVIQALFKYPMLRTFYHSYGNNMLEILHTFGINCMKDIPNSFKEYTTPAKALGISNSLMKAIAESCKEESVYGLADLLSLQNSINPQVLETIIQTFLRIRKQILEEEDEARCKNFELAAKGIADIILTYGGPSGKSYDFARLLRYITEDVCVYQGIDSPAEATKLLLDYYNMMTEMKTKITEWFPKSLKLTHDITVRNYNLVIEQINHEKFADAVAAPEYQALKYKDSEWVVLAPQCEKDIITEGRHLSHCVGSYVKHVANGKNYILFMRAANDPNTPVITLDVDPKTKELLQYKGFGNRDPKESEMAFIQKWAKEKGLTII